MLYLPNVWPRAQKTLKLTHVLQKLTQYVYVEMKEKYKPPS